VAIKGKGRSKRRGVAAAPKPVYVKPKRPLLGRRWFQVTVLSVIVVGAVAGVVTALLIKHHDNQIRARTAAEKSITQRFGTTVDTDLSGVGQPFQTEFSPFPTLSSDISQFEAGTLSVSAAESKASGYAKAARDAAAAIQKIPTSQMIQGYAALVPLSDAQNSLSQALQVYEQVADQFRLAVRATGTQQRAFLAHTSALATVASSIFSSGYQKLVNVRSMFGLLTTAAPPQGLTPTGVPLVPATGGAPPGKTSYGKTSYGKSSGGKAARGSGGKKK
jgi:hypothetical protein